MRTIARRDFISGVAGAAAWPLAARAQQGAVPVIGYIGVFPDLRTSSSQAAFLRGLRETGYIDGQNVSIAYRWTEGRNDPVTALPLARDLVERRVSVIVAQTVPLGIAAQAATHTIPLLKPEKSKRRRRFWACAS